MNSWAASSLLDPSRLAAVSVAQVRRLLDFDGASLTVWDSDQGVLVPLAFDDERMTDPDPVFHIGQGLSGTAYARDAPVLASDYAREDPTDEAIVRAAATLGRAFDMRVVAEGVEGRAVLDAVRRLECDFVQGFLVARPMAASALREWVDGR